MSGTTPSSKESSAPGSESGSVAAAVYDTNPNDMAEESEDIDSMAVDNENTAERISSPKLTSEATTHRCAPLVASPTAAAEGSIGCITGGTNFEPPAVDTNDPDSQNTVPMVVNDAADETTVEVNSRDLVSTHKSNNNEIHAEDEVPIVDTHTDTQNAVPMTLDKDDTADHNAFPKRSAEEITDGRTSSDILNNSLMDIDDTELQEAPPSFSPLSDIRPTNSFVSCNSTTGKLKDDEDYPPHKSSKSNDSSSSSDENEFDDSSLKGTNESKNNAESSDKSESSSDSESTGDDSEALFPRKSSKSNDSPSDNDDNDDDSRDSDKSHDSDVCDQHLNHEILNEALCLQLEHCHNCKLVKVGVRIRVHWYKEGTWFDGIVKSVSPNFSCKVEYDDGCDPTEICFMTAIWYLPDEPKSTEKQEPSDSIKHEIANWVFWNAKYPHFEPVVDSVISYYDFWYGRWLPAKIIALPDENNLSTLETDLRDEHTVNLENLMWYPIIPDQCHTSASKRSCEQVVNLVALGVDSKKKKISSSEVTLRSNDLKSTEKVCDLQEDFVEVHTQWKYVSMILKQQIGEEEYQKLFNSTSLLKDPTEYGVVHLVNTPMVVSCVASDCSSLSVSTSSTCSGSSITSFLSQLDSKMRFLPPEDPAVVVISQCCYPSNDGSGLIIKSRSSPKKIGSYKSAQSIKTPNNASHSHTLSCFRQSIAAWNPLGEYNIELVTAGPAGIPIKDGLNEDRHNVVRNLQFQPKDLTDYDCLQNIENQDKLRVGHVSKMTFVPV